MQFLVDPSLGG